MKIFLDVIGCRLNQSEVEGFANIFRALGHQIVEEPVEADLAIVNTCAVTVKAAADSRKQLRQAGRKGAHQVVATGCWATLHPDATAELPGVTGVITNQQKDTLVTDLLNLAPEAVDKLQLVREPIAGSRARTRAFVKVQEGCDNHCTYCLTRLARGRSRSRSLVQVDKDVQAAMDGGAKEVVLTGVQLGAWGRDLVQPMGLDKLLSHVLGHQDLHRLRLSSIEPWDFKPEWLDFWQDTRLCRHLHIPLQSGSERILRAMGRPIKIHEYTALIEMIRISVPEVALTTDVIVGFPGETAEDFTATRVLIQEIGFADGHVFSYSPRPGTVAFNIKPHVPVHEARQRNAELRGSFRMTGEPYRKQFVGRQVSVLWETSKQSETGNWRLSGLTDNYLRVHSVFVDDLWNRISTVEVMSSDAEQRLLIGKIVN